jgi:hypothetical protein
MNEGKATENPESRFSVALVSAARLPGVRIHREAYLRKALARYCSEEEIRVAVEQTPAVAGISLDVLDKAANDSIRYETAKVSALSAAAGLRVMFGTQSANAAVGKVAEMTKQTFAKSVSKAIPVVGAAISGTLTFATYRPMAKRLKKHLADSELARPMPRVVVVEAEEVYEPSVVAQAENPVPDETAVAAEASPSA